MGGPHKSKHLFFNDVLSNSLPFTQYIHVWQHRQHGNCTMSKFYFNSLIFMKQTYCCSASLHECCNFHLQLLHQSVKHRRRMLLLDTKVTSRTHPQHIKHNTTDDKVNSMRWQRQTSMDLNKTWRNLCAFEFEHACVGTSQATSYAQLTNWHATVLFAAFSKLDKPMLNIGIVSISLPWFSALNFMTECWWNRHKIVFANTLESW